MRTDWCEYNILKQLASMPFLDRLELAAVIGRSRGAVYEAVRKLQSERLVDSVPHASQIIPPTRRYCLTVNGLHRLAREEGMTVGELLVGWPVSEQARRILMERLDALASVYRLASALSNVAHPVRFRWYRAMPMDAAVTLPDGKTVAVVRQGLTADRTAFSKRLWRLREAFRPSAVLLMVPDEVRLRHARRLMAGSPSIAFLALESDAVSAGEKAPVWHPPSGPAVLDLGTAMSFTRRRGAWPVENPPSKAFPPEELTLENPERETPGWMLPVLLKPAEKRAVDLLSDWPWIAPAHLGELLGVKRSMLSRILVRLQELGLAVEVNLEGGRRLALSDRGLTILARRDRSSVGAAKTRWSVMPANTKASLDWRNVTGRRTRQLLRNVEHTDAVHWFVAVLERQAHSSSWDVAQLDPPRRASRYFRHGDRLRSIHPDAFCILRKEDSTLPFFLEWERRAVRPATMAERIAPYLRYYSSRRPTDDHGVLPSVLVVFENELAHMHFLRVAGEEMERTGVSVPLRVSHRSLLERVGPRGRAWRTIDDSEPGYAFREL